MVFLKKILSFLIFIFVILSCSGSKQNSYRSVEPNKDYYKTYQIYIDSSFSEVDKIIIKESIAEWNNALNGFISIEIKSDSLDSKDVKQLHNVYYNLLGSNSGLMILNLYHDDELVFNDTPNVLAFVNAIGDGAKMMIVLRDRVEGKNLHKILLHEFGHAFGARHIEKISLMHPYYGIYQTDCIDVFTAAQVANYHGFDLKKMNYCGAD